MAKIILKEVPKIVIVAVKSCCRILVIGSQSDRSTKFFSGHKHCCDGQRPLAGRYLSADLVSITLSNIAFRKQQMIT